MLIKFITTTSLLQQRTQIGMALLWMMSGLRISIEWIFGEFTGLFKCLDFGKGQKIQESPVSLLISELSACMYGSMHNDYFNLDPPSIEDYLSQKLQLNHG